MGLTGKIQAYKYKLIHNTTKLRRKNYEKLKRAFKASTGNVR
jgi:hypothetical protein